MEVVSSLAAPLQQLAAAGSLEVEVVEVVSSLAARLEQVVAAGSLQAEVVEVVSSPPLAAQVGVLSAESTLALAPSRTLVVLADLAAAGPQNLQEVLFLASVPASRPEQLEVPFSAASVEAPGPAEQQGGGLAGGRGLGLAFCCTTAWRGGVP